MSEAEANSSRRTLFNTGLFREHQKHIDRYFINRHYDDFIKTENFEKYVCSMFYISREDFQLLTESELQDIKNFARHVFKRLAYSAAYSAHQDFLDEGNTPRDFGSYQIATKIENGIRNGDHDLVHALIAYARSLGKTFRPAYDSSLSKHDKYHGQEAISEEIFVSVFQQFWVGPDEKYIASAIRGESPLSESSLRIRLLDGASDFSPEMKIRLASYESLRLSQKESDRVKFVAYMISEAFAVTLSNKNDDPRSPSPYSIENCTFFIRSHDQAYFDLLTTLYRNFTQEKPDPLVRFRWFAKTAAPLLKRLRK